jgi:hypothetical protein
MCPKCEAEIYTEFNRHAYAMDDDIRASKQLIPECRECK